MIFSIINYNGEKQLCCVDKVGERAFLLKEFFERDLSDLCICSNDKNKMPKSLDELKENYEAIWTDDMALFFGSNPELGITLEADNYWAPIEDTKKIWSPLGEGQPYSLV